MTPFERARAFQRARTAVLKDRAKLLAGTRDNVIRFLKAAAADIRAILAAQPSDYQLWALAALEREIAQTIGRLGDQAAAEAAAATGRAWELGQGMVDRPLAAARVVAVLGRLDTRQLLAMRAFMTSRLKDVALEAGKKIAAQLGLVVIGAETPSDAISSITEILGEPSRKRATTIVRTELGRVFAVAAHERLVQAAEKVPGMQKQWRRSGKLHPRVHHDVADGQVRDVAVPFDLYPPGAQKPVQLMFPHDPKAPASEVINCGCVALPYKADWKVANPKRVPGGQFD